MSIRSATVVGSVTRTVDSTFSVASLNLQQLRERASPVMVLDNFRVSGQPFGPHPHAGFSAVTYVLEESPAALRSRDSLGNDIIMRPGGIVWTQAGSGMLHHELPAEPGRELQGLQVFVNLSSKNKQVTPQVLRLDRDEMVDWHGTGGEHVRVVVGSYQGVSSPLIPAEPFTWLDVQLQREVSFELPEGHNALVYVLSGSVQARIAGDMETVASEQALALHGNGGKVVLQSSRPAHFLMLSGAQINEPVVSLGTGFMMSSRLELESATARYHAGKMGHLPPL